MDLEELIQINDQQIKVADFRASLVERTQDLREKQAELEMRIQIHKLEVIKRSIENAVSFEKYQQLLAARATFYREVKKLYNARKQSERRIEKLLSQIDRIDDLYLGHMLPYKDIPKTWAAFKKLATSSTMFPATDGKCFTKNSKPGLKCPPTIPMSIAQMAHYCYKNSYTIKVASPEFLVLSESIVSATERAEELFVKQEERLASVQGKLEELLQKSWEKNEVA